MTTIVTRSGKGSALSWTEVDTNFTNLNTDKAENSVVDLKAPLDSPTFTGTVSGISATDITLEPTGSLSSTNTQAGIAELESEKAALTGANFSGNVSIPKTQMGVSATASENHFWDGSVANQLSLKRGTPAAPGAELIKALNGELSFPNQEQSLTQNGYVKLPGGLIVQWGQATTPGTGSQVVTLPIAFPNTIFTALASCRSSVGASGVAQAAVVGSSNSTISVGLLTTAGAWFAGGVNWIAIGY